MNNKTCGESIVLNCPCCGKEFHPRNVKQKYCCSSCQKKENGKNQWDKRRAKVYHKKCPHCGKWFDTKACNKVYCSTHCRQQASSKRNSNGGKDRPFTQDTAFLVQKYAAEGMSIEQIAKVLHRDIDSIYKGLSTPITAYQKACIMTYFNPYRERKKGEVDKCAI